MSLLVKIGADLSGFEKQMKKATREINAVAKTVGDIGKELTTKVTLPLTAIGVASLKVGMDFQSAMSEVAAISGATGDELKALEDAAKEMGKKTSKSASESAQALKYMSLAGWDATTSIQALEPVLRLSEAGNLDLARTSDLVTDSMASLGLTADQLEGYLDMVAQTSRKSNTNIDSLMEAMLIAGGTFKNLNVPLDEANALLGILANRGKKGSEAGNALNSIMVNLTSGAGQAGEALENLGISAFDSEGNFKGMAVVLEELSEKTADLTEEQRTQYLAMIGGKTQLDTLQALLSGVSEEYVELKGNVSDSTGVLNDMAATMQDNLQGELTRLKSALEGVGIQIATVLIPIVSAIVEKIQVWVDWFANLDESTQKTIVIIGMIVAAIGPLLLAVAKGIALYGKLKAAALILAPAIGAISWPVIAVTAAVAALVVGGIALYKNWDVVKEKSKAAWGAIKEAIRGPANAIIGFANGIIGAYERMINGMGSAINKIPSIKVPDWVPGLGGKSFGIPKIPTVSLPKVPALATGTNYVPRDMLALIHKGEAVVPKKYNPALGGNNGMHKQPIHLHMNVDGYTVATRIVDYLDLLQGSRNGQAAYLGGVR